MPVRLDCRIGEVYGKVVCKARCWTHSVNLGHERGTRSVEVDWRSCCFLLYFLYEILSVSFEVLAGSPACTHAQEGVVCIHVSACSLTCAFVRLELVDLSATGLVPLVSFE